MNKRDKARNKFQGISPENPCPSQQTQISLEFSGTYFDGMSSRAHPVTIVFDGEFLNIHADKTTPVITVSLDECVFKEPLGITRRSISLPDGALCETYDGCAVEALERLKGANKGMNIVHILESNWITVAAGIAGLVLFIWGFTVYAIPYLAEKAAYSMPVELTDSINDKTLDMLDDRFVAPSELSEEKAAAIHALFLNITNEDTGFDYRLELRKGHTLGANAFALPAGTIVITDELVELAQNDREIAGVIVHELAHVRMRHGLRSIFQNAGVFLLVSVLAGDVTSITSTAATFPTFIIESGYSRDFERQADAAAGAYCIREGWTTKPYEDILMHLSENSQGKSGPSWLSSHPDIQERIRLIQELDNKPSQTGDNPGNIDRH